MSGARPARGSRPLRPLRALRRELQGRWIARLPRTDQLLLTQRNVYILPTSAGWMLALTLAVLLIASINYQLNLGYLLTFLLAGSAAAGMLVGHANLRGLVLHLQPPAAVFAGQRCALRITLDNPARRARHGVALAVSQDLEGAPQWAWTDVPAQASAVVELAFVPRQRGWHPLPRITAETRFPLGSFRAWSYWRPATQLLVYPEAEAAPPPLPPARPQGTGRAGTRAAGNEDFDGVRAYRRGDPLKQVVWKKAAQAWATGGALVSRDQPQAQPGRLWLDPAATGLVDTEARIARLTAWVLAADRQGVQWGLDLPGAVRLAPDSGLSHRERSLQALALYAPAPGAAP